MKRAALIPLILASACVYFNAMYNASRLYDQGMRDLRAGNPSTARVAFDSVIQKAGRIVANHPDSKYAAAAAILKARSELNNQQWESAGESAELAARLARDEETLHIAVGLAGIAQSQLEQPAAADSLLTVAIDGPIGPDDRALFLFYRGQVRLDLELPGPATEDLQAASREIDLSDDARTDLARALAGIEDYPGAARLVRDLLESNRYGDLSPGLQTSLDTLSRLAPDVVDSLLAGLLEAPQTQSTKTSVLYFLRGRARHYAGDDESALAYLDSAVSTNRSSRYGSPEAAFLAARLRLEAADEPATVRETESYFALAAGSSDLDTRLAAQRRLDWVRRFSRLSQAYESRGSAAAEAVLRAAEVAGNELGAAAVARGYYLVYLDLVPESPWTAKAIYGALAWSGHRPGAWVEDRGEETDAELRRRLAELPAEDPYRIAAEGTGRRTELSDSLYVRAERDLYERIATLQTAFDPDAAPAAAESAGEADSTASGEEQRVQ